MFARSIKMTPISGNGVRPSLFGGTIEQTRSFHPTLSGGHWMAQGTTPADWYRRAKESLVKFDALLARTARIANKTVRDEVLAWVGTAGKQDSPAYRYNSVLSDLKDDVEAYTPANINAYQVSRRTNRIEKLEDYNAEFETQVMEAEAYYGKLPDPVIIERERIMSSGGTNWTLPLLVGAGAIGVAVLVSALSGGKA